MITKILITAGPTQEPIDPVRYISNHSSGKMGIALAKQAHRMGCEVLLIHGPLTVKIPSYIKCLPVITAENMRQKVLKAAPRFNIIIMAAAVADYRVEKIASQKIKKTKDHLNLKLINNPDILSELGKMKKTNQILVGFAAETHDLQKYALEKLNRKKCDYIVANDVSRKDIGFGSDQNEAWLVSSNQSCHFKKASKTQLAKNILSALLK
jgi:phosphopantothenoylcysteine decarboxylase/phosphopantothenate--cysteine ligase